MQMRIRRAVNSPSAAKLGWDVRVELAWPFSCLTSITVLSKEEDSYWSIWPAVIQDLFLRTSCVNEFAVRRRYRELSNLQYLTLKKFNSKTEEYWSRVQRRSTVSKWHSILSLSSWIRNMQSSQFFRERERERVLWSPLQDNHINKKLVSQFFLQSNF